MRERDPPNPFLSLRMVEVGVGPPPLSLPPISRGEVDGLFYAYSLLGIFSSRVPFFPA